MSVEVVAADPQWPAQFDQVANNLATALAGVRVSAIEHVGSTSVPGLAAKPVLDIDILVNDNDMVAAIQKLTEAGYTRRGDLGVTGREAFGAPDDNPPRNVYLSTPENLHIKNHLAVREVLRTRTDLRDEYAAVKQSLAADPNLDIDTYIAGKSAILQKVLAETSLSDTDRRAILTLNDPNAARRGSAYGAAGNTDET